MKKRVADIVMEILVKNKIVDCFAVVGGGAMFLDNALLLCQDMNKYFNHNEQASAMAAEAYARLSGNMAAVCVTSGPGTTNTLTGVLGAWQDSIPMIVLSGQVRYEISVSKANLPLRYRGIQEFEIIPTVQNMTKYSKMITDPLSIACELNKAIQIANSGRKGPVWIDIPQDIQNTMVEENDLYPLHMDNEDKLAISDSQIVEIVDIINSAASPCILAGSGIISGGVRSEFFDFIDRLRIPVIGGAWVAGICYNEHPYFFGLSGNVGPRTGNFILQNADVIISIGNSLGFRQTGFNQENFAPNAKIYMIDADENEAKKPGLRIEKLFHTDLTSFFETVKKAEFEILPNKEWMTYCENLKNRFNAFEALDNLDMEERVCSYYFWNIFQKYEKHDSILALGNNTGNSAKLQIGTLKKDQRVITNYTCGSMGYDIPAAIGAAVASKKQVFCITGDGSIMMNLQELQTIVQYDLPIHIIVFSNDGYGAIRQTSKNFFNGKYIGCTPDTGVSFPAFNKIADAFGFQYMECNRNKDLEDVLRVVMDSKERVMLEIFQRFDDPIIPKVMSRLDENGKMLTPALHDMFPFLSKEEMDSLVYNKK